MQRRTFASLSAAVVAGGALLLGSPVTASAEPTSNRAADCPSGEQVELEDLTSIDPALCDLSGAAILLPDGRDMGVPDPGFSVTGHPLSAPGSPEAPSVTVSNAPGGGVAVKLGDDYYGVASAVGYQKKIDPAEPAILVDAESSSLAASDRCASGSPYVYSGPKWSGNYSWRYRPIGQPTGALAAIQAGAAKWTGSISTCGSSYSSTATQSSNSASTGARPGVTDDAGCYARHDSNSDVGWMPLSVDLNYIAYTCTWSFAGNFLHADQAYNTNYLWSTGTTCSGYKFDVRATATHEFGHAFGMDHVEQSSGQVMRPDLDYCDIISRNLGRGDAVGISNLY